MYLEILASGLKGLQDVLTRDWFGPLIMIVGIAFMVYFLVKRNWAAFAGFLVLFACATAVTFFADSLFGNSGVFTNVVKQSTSLIGTFIVPLL